MLMLGTQALQAAEAPSNEQLYEMVRELQANQAELLQRLDHAEEDARSARSELERTRRALAIAQQGKQAPAAAPQPPQAQADPDLPGILLGQKNGWAVSTDGRVNAYMVNISGDAPPAGNDTGGVVITGSTSESDIDSYRVRTGFNPSALGTLVMLDGNALDASGRERDHDGWYAQYRYNFTPRFGSGVAWGESTADETAFDRASGTPFVEDQSNWSLMSWYRWTDYVTFMAQFTDATTDYTVGGGQENQLMAIGAILSW